MEDVRAQATGHGVVTPVSGDEVSAGTPAQRVVALATAHGVVAIAAIAAVVTKVAVDEVAAIVAAYEVIVLAAATLSERPAPPQTSKAAHPDGAIDVSRDEPGNENKQGSFRLGYATV